MLAELLPILAHGLPLAPIHDITAYPNRRQLVDLNKSVEPKICFIDFGANRDEAFATLTEVLSVAPSISVVALLPANDPDIILRCLRSGACDFLIRPFTTDQIDAAVDKIARLQPPPAMRSTGGGRIVAVIPAKGACGATTIACNLAHQAKRLGSKKTLLCDFDPLAGTISFLLKLKSSYSFLDVLHRHAGLDHDLWKQMVVNSNGVDVLLSPETTFDYANELPSAAQVLEFAQASYDAIIVDTGGAFGNWNLSIATLADEVLLVTSNELAALQAAQKVLLYFETHRVDTSKVKVVVNRYLKDAGLNNDHIHKALDAEVCTVVPFDYDAVQKSLMESKPIGTGSSAGKALTALADKVITITVRHDSKKPAKGSKLLSSLFSR